MRIFRLLPILLLLSAATLSAQKKTTAATVTATDKAVKDACACLEKTPSKGASQETLQKVGTDCMTTAMMTHIMDLAKEYGIDPSEMNEENGRKIGEQFGLQLAQKCPASVPFLMALGSQQMQEAEAGAGANTAYDDQGTATGTFVRLDAAGELAKIVVKVDGEDESFYWIRPFAGSETLEKQAKTLAGKRVQVQWAEFKKYVPAMKGYAKVKEVTGVKVL